MPAPKAMIENAKRLLAAGQPGMAIPILLDVLKRHPADLAALDALMQAGLMRRDFSGVPEACERAVQAGAPRAALDPRLAAALLDLGQFRKAIDPARRDSDRQPNSPDALARLGVALVRAGDKQEGFEALRKAAGLAPSNPRAWYTLGALLLEFGEAREALPALEKAIALAPNDPPILSALGRAMQETGRCAEGLERLRRAAAAAPLSPEGRADLGVALRDLGHAEEGLGHIRAALEMRPNSRSVRETLLMTLNYVSQDGAMMRREHQEFGGRYEQAVPKMPDPPKERFDPERPIRVGVLSGDFRTHSCAYFMMPLLSGLPRPRFEVFAVSNSPVDDAMTKKMRAMCEGWVGVHGVDRSGAARLVREAGIDVLIECHGVTANHRLDICAEAPAPVQMTFLGYPNTTGLSRIDWRVVDPITDPAPDADGYAVERLARLAECLWCFRPSDEAPDVAPAPVDANGFVTIGCFNNLAKITPGCVEAWAEVLRRVPTARLLLKNKWLADPGTLEAFRGRFAALGVDPARVDAIAFTKTTAEHLASYGRIDFQLDTFPYNGTTTTCESFWQGVPVVAVTGRVHAARVSHSLLSAVGLNELVAPDIEGYVTLAAGLALDPPRLVALRRSMRERMTAGPLRDEAGYGRRFGEVIEAAWRERCARA